MNYLSNQEVEVEKTVDAQVLTKTDKQYRFLYPEVMAGKRFWNQCRKKEKRELSKKTETFLFLWPVSSPTFADHFPKRKTALVSEVGVGQES